MQTTTTTWPRVQSHASRLGLRAECDLLDRSVVVTITGGDLDTSVVVLHGGMAAVIRARRRRPILHGDDDRTPDEAYRRALDLATSELVRIEADRRQWRGGLS